MSKKHTSLESNTDWERLDAMTDDDIDFSDIPPLTEEQLQAMRPHAEVMAEHGIEFDPTEPITVTVHHEDGSTTTYEKQPSQRRMVVLDPDVGQYFPDSESVNRTLRLLISLIPEKKTKSETEEILPEYDFSEGIRGKHVRDKD
jgi:hypothetical protein